MIMIKGSYDIDAADEKEDEQWTGKLVWMAFLTAVRVWRRPKLSPILVVVLGFCLHGDEDH